MLGSIPSFRLFARFYDDHDSHNFHLLFCLISAGSAIPVIRALLGRRTRSEEFDTLDAFLRNLHFPNLARQPGRRKAVTTNARGYQ